MYGRAFDATRYTNYVLAVLARPPAGRTVRGLLARKLPRLPRHELCDDVIDVNINNQSILSREIGRTMTGQQPPEVRFVLDHQGEPARRVHGLEA